MTSNEVITVTLKISGRVQGVGYRMFCCEVAKDCQVTGTVKNRSDGAVEVCATATRPQIDKFIEKCYEGNGWAKVTDIYESETEPMKFFDFKVIF